MIKTVLALATGGVIGLGFLTQEGGQTQEEETKAKTIVKVETEEVVETERPAKTLSLTLQGHPEIRQDVIVKVVENLADLNVEMAEMSRKLGPQHPAIVALKSKSDALKGMLLELKSDAKGGIQVIEIEDAEVAEGEEVEEAIEQEHVKGLATGGVYSFEINGNEVGVGKAIGITKDERINLRLGTPGGPAIIRSGIAGMRPAQVFGVASTGPFSEYAGKWQDATEDERAEMLSEMRQKASEKFDEEMKRREEELSEIKKRYDRLDSLLKRRAEKREEIIENYLEGLQLEWEDLSFPGNRFPTGFSNQIFSLGKTSNPAGARAFYRFPGGQKIEPSFFNAEDSPEAPKAPEAPAAPVQRVQ